LVIWPSKSRTQIRPRVIAPAKRQDDLAVNRPRALESMEITKRYHMPRTDHSDDYRRPAARPTKNPIEDFVLPAPPAHPQHQPRLPE